MKHKKDALIETHLRNRKLNETIHENQKLKAVLRKQDMVITELESSRKTIDTCNLGEDES